MIALVDQNLNDDATANMPSFSFPKINHLRYKREFKRVFDMGAYKRGKYFSVLACEIQEDPIFKVGFVVKKKFFKRAVDRNLIKRRLREVVRLNVPVLCHNQWLVVMAGPNALQACWNDLNQDFIDVCLKLKILKNTAS